MALPNTNAPINPPTPAPTPDPTPAPPAPPAQPPPVGPPPTPPVQAPAGEPITFPNSEAFAARLERDRKAKLKEEFGTSDPAEIKAKLARAAELEKAEEERKKAAMSESERLTKERDEARAEAEAARAAALTARDEAALAQRGITNIDYAKWRLAQLRAAHKDLDSTGLVAKLLEDPAQHAALGIGGAPMLPPTQPTTSIPPHTAPTPNAVTPGAKTSIDMDAAEWQRRKASLGLA